MNIFKHLLVALLMVLPCGQLLSADESSQYDYWYYQKSDSGWRIFYQGEPIEFISNIGDGTFSRKFEISPLKRYIFIDNQLTLSQADGIVSFWLTWDPRTPTEFIVINSDCMCGYRYHAYFDKVSVPSVMSDGIKKIVGPTKKEPADQP